MPASACACAVLTPIISSSPPFCCRCSCCCCWSQVLLLSPLGDRKDESLRGGRAMSKHPAKSFPFPAPAREGLERAPGRCGELPATVPSSLLWTNPCGVKEGSAAEAAAAEAAPEEVQSAATAVAAGAVEAKAPLPQQGMPSGTESGGVRAGKHPASPQTATWAVACEAGGAGTDAAPGTSLAATEARACWPMSIDERLDRSADLPSWTGTTGMRPQLQISTMLWSGSWRKICVGF